MLLTLMDELTPRYEKNCKSHNKKLEYFCLDDKVL